MDFKIVGGLHGVPTVLATIASATVIEAGDMVTLDTGLVVKADETSAALAYAPLGSANGETKIEVTVGNDFVLEGTGDAVFAVAQKGTEVDLVMDSADQQIDVGSSTTDVFLVDVSENAGTVDSASGIRVKINKPLF